MMGNDRHRSGRRLTWRVLGLLVLVLGLAACNSDNFIIPPAPGMESDMMPMMAKEDSMMSDAVMMAASQSSLGCVAVVNTDGVRLRTGPSNQHSILGLAYMNDALSMQSLSQDLNWVEITAPSGTRAYIAAEFTDTVCPEG